MKMMIGLLIMLGMFLLVGIKLISGASWSAYVFEENGTGIDAVNVTGIHSGTSAFLNSTLTTATGFFNLTIPDFIPIKIVSSKSGYLTDTSQSLPPISDDRVLQFNITLKQALPGDITGKITNSTGSGIENANVSAIQGSSTVNSTLTDLSGDYLLANLLDGTYTIEASALGYTAQNTTNVVLLPNSTTSVNFTLTPETVPPIISSISATLITSSEAVIIWQTDELANSNVYYRKVNDSILISGSLTLTTSHMIRLSSLSSSTLYYYNVSSCDFAGNCNTSEQFNFTTSGVTTPAGEGVSGGGGGGGVAALTTTSMILGQGARIAINVGGEIHYVEVIEITNTTVTINISSIPQQAILRIGEEKKFEITDDNFYDILVRLNGIENNNANLTISSIHEEVSRQPRQLLDINLNLVDSSIQEISGLVAIMSFKNFEEEPIHVKLLFTILNDEGEEVYSEDGSIEVATEEILRKSFEGIDLPQGKYTFILTTLYDVDVVDEFRQEFEIRGGIGITGRAIDFVRGERYLTGVIVGVLAIVSVLYLIKISKRLKKKHEDKFNKKIKLLKHKLPKNKIIVIIRKKKKNKIRVRHKIKGGKKNER